MTHEQITNRIKDLTVVAELGSDFSNQAKFYSYELVNNPLFMTVLMAFHKEYECPVRGYGVRLSSTTKASGLVEIAAIRSGDIMAKASVKLPKTESSKQIRVQLTDVIPLDESSLWFLVQDFAIAAMVCYLNRFCGQAWEPSSEISFGYGFKEGEEQLLDEFCYHMTAMTAVRPVVARPYIDNEVRRIVLWQGKLIELEAIARTSIEVMGVMGQLKHPRDLIDRFINCYRLPEPCKATKY